MKLARSQVALGILAGGRAVRMGGADKASMVHRGERLLDRTLAAAGPGFAQRLLSYNAGDIGVDVRVVPDLRSGQPGPLAGIEALLDACEAPWLLSLPVDVEAIPQDLFARLAEAARAVRLIHNTGEYVLDNPYAPGMHAREATVGVRARDAEGVQPLIALWSVPIARAAVAAALEAGEGAVHRVQERLGFVDCDFSPLRFGNLNSLVDLRA